MGIRLAGEWLGGEAEGANLFDANFAYVRGRANDGMVSRSPGRRFSLAVRLIDKEIVMEKIDKLAMFVLIM